MPVKKRNVLEKKPAASTYQFRLRSYLINNTINASAFGFQWLRVTGPTRTTKKYIGKEFDTIWMVLLYLSAT
ncbi:hypothetical protein DESC_390016 [Desulfosarcina cetonica]|nr:hypothetical protein DESC_390016 [Desulfosarcina cetonica]